MRQNCDLGYFRPYKVGADNVQNIWTIKSTLKLFELSSGLKINFNKCTMYGLNIDEALSLRLAGFLHCRISNNSISYLGIPVGVNHKRKSSWSALINRIQFKLSSWNSKHISFGDRVILLNVVLSALPNYFLSFYKAPSSVMRSIQQIQRNFLWGGADGSRKINWVKWENVFKSKNDGGLGVKDISAFNISMLGKWNWRMMIEGDSLWCKVLKSKYGSDFHNLIQIPSSSSMRKKSPWVRDLASITPRVTDKSNWFWGNITRHIGNGYSTSFWHDIWLGVSNLSTRYRRLFSINLLPHGNISEFGSWEGDTWECNFSWRRNFFTWELDIFNSFF
ncbi:hypothetical protein Lal_00050163 [Lupinus albus]|nr:hypothetical protein Lal_00050163 [Lupinus albus]